MKKFILTIAMISCLPVFAADDPMSAYEYASYRLMNRLTYKLCENNKREMREEYGYNVKEIKGLRADKMTMSSEQLRRADVLDDYQRRLTLAINKPCVLPVE